MRAGHVAHPPSPPTVYGLILRSFHKDLLDEYAYKLISDLMKSENTSSKDVWNENISCHINQEEMSLASKCARGLPKLGSSGCHHPSWWLLWSWANARSKMNKEAGLAPGSWSAYERNEFSEPRGLHLPIHRRLNSLTWYLIFDVQRACSLCASLCAVWHPLLPPWSSFLSYCEADSWAQNPKHSHQIKLLSTFRLWI